MTILNILYWVLLVLAIIAVFAPAEIFPRLYLPGIIYIVLFIIIGLKVFRTSLS